MTVDWSNAEIRQTAIDGRLQAMREQNIEAVELFNHNRRLGKFATLSLVRFAVMEAGCNRSIVFDTMSTAAKWGSVTSWACAELDEWCDERIKVGGSKGRWLKTKLEELRAANELGDIYQSDRTCYSQHPITELDSAAEDCDGGAEYQLGIKQHKWDQVSEIHISCTAHLLIIKPLPCSHFICMFVSIYEATLMVLNPFD
jgi:hypothetical protein